MGRPRKAPRFLSPTDAPTITQFSGLETTILTGLNGEKMMMALGTVLPGHTVPEHSHPNEQIGVVYAGKAKFRIGDEERTIQKGDFYCVPANVPHGGTCISEEPLVMLDVFYPVRKDFIKKLKQQARARK